MAASELMLQHADQLWAVWDGQPARGYGGTALTWSPPPRAKRPARAGDLAARRAHRD